MNVWRVVLRVAAAVALIAYPVFVWLGLSSGSPRTVALVLLAVMAPAMLLRRRSGAQAAVKSLAIVPITILVVLGVAAVLDGEQWILWTPVATNAVLLFAFASTLRAGSTPMIERFARLQQKELDAGKVAWCRAWTWGWCAFFVGNGATAAALATWAERSWWALYNGMICYALIGLMALGEFVLRRRRFPHLRQRNRRADATAHDASTDAAPDRTRS
ncbi:MAG: hypothetical protein H6835_05460 [Planctomycetes bacterium]|nr:hypothetical protein [Planctomycetota bacterium]